MTIKTTYSDHEPTGHGEGRAGDMTTWIAEADGDAARRLAPQAAHRMADPRVGLVRLLAAKEPEDLCEPGTLRHVLAAVNIEAMPEEDRMMLLEVLLGLLPEDQLAAVAARAQVELDKLAELERAQPSEPIL